MKQDDFEKWWESTPYRCRGDKKVDNYAKTIARLAWNEAKHREFMKQVEHEQHERK